MQSTTQPWGSCWGKTRDRLQTARDGCRQGFTRAAESNIFIAAFVRECRMLRLRKSSASIDRSGPSGRISKDHELTVSRKNFAKSLTSFSVVSNEHIQRTTDCSSFQT